MYTAYCACSQKKTHKPKVAIVEIRCIEGGEENENTAQPPLIIEKKLKEIIQIRFLSLSSEEGRSVSIPDEVFFHYILRRVPPAFPSVFMNL